MYWASVLKEGKKYVDVGDDGKCEYGWNVDVSSGYL
jgi:hypothetical protein